MSVRDLSQRFARVAHEGPAVMAGAAAARLRAHFEGSVHVRTGQTASETTIEPIPDGVRVAGPRSLRFPPSRDAIHPPEGTLGAAAGKALQGLLGGAL